MRRLCVLALIVGALAWRAVPAGPSSAAAPCDPIVTEDTTTTTTTIANVAEETSTTSTSTTVPQACEPATTSRDPPPATVEASTTLATELTTSIVGPVETAPAPETTLPATTTEPPQTITLPAETVPPTTTPPVEATEAPAPPESLAPTAAPVTVDPPVATVPAPEPPTTAPAEVPSPPTKPTSTEPPTTVPVPATTVPEELESAPVVVPPPSPSGNVLAAAGVSDVGAVRPIVFPVAGPVRYGNDFGVCRDGCARQHKGVDIIGDRLQPLVAMREGVVDRLLEHPTAGFGVVIRDAEGWEYHQYHMNNDTPGTDDGLDAGAWRFADGIIVGARVTAGQLIGWMGDSGNSEGSVPHTHVEIHTPTGDAINPFWSLRHAQRAANCGLLPRQPAQETSARRSDLLDRSWSSPALLDELPGEWTALGLTGGRPTTDEVAARMWIGRDGFTPIDVAAAGVGDRRYDDENCEPTVPGAPAPTSAVAAPPPVQPIPAELGPILATIRAMETGGNYLTQVTSSTASGAYAFLDGSWDGYGGYRRARDAPPEVQDAKAAWLASYILERNGGDVSTIPVSWYIGHVPRGAEWDTVPPVGANVLTPREYQARWMAMYAKVLGQPNTWVTGVASSYLPVGPMCRTTLIDLAGPGEPTDYGLTQVGTFVDDGTGRAVPAANDPCDPHRPAR